MVTLKTKFGDLPMTRGEVLLIAPLRGNDLAARALVDVKTILGGEIVAVNVRGEA